MSNKTVPLVVDMPDGTKKQVGTAEVAEDGESVSVTVTDPEYKALIEGEIRQFSIEHPNEPVRHNVFDKKEK